MKRRIRPYQSAFFAELSKKTERKLPTEWDHSQDYETKQSLVEQLIHDGYPLEFLFDNLIHYTKPADVNRMASEIRSYFTPSEASLHVSHKRVVNQIKYGGERT